MTENNQPKISVIIPVYNVEEYIGACLESLINQTFSDIEIICVNDETKDKSREVIERYAQKDNRIKIIDKENGGPSSARNVGMDYAKGEYISFIDSDDWVDKNYLEKLYNAIIKNNCDIAAATIIRKRKNSQKYRVHYTEEKVYSTLQEKIEVCRIPVCCYIWNKLYKKEKIQNLKFKEGVYFEDVLWTPEALKVNGDLVTVPDTNYYYRVNKNSIVKKIQSDKKQEDSYNSKKYIIKFFEENNLPLSKKSRTITKKIVYFLNIPIYKVKEFEGKETGYLFGLIKL